MERQVGPQWADCGGTTWKWGKQGLSYGWKRSRLLPAQGKVREWGVLRVPRGRGVGSVWRLCLQAQNWPGCGCEVVDTYEVTASQGPS